MADQPNTLQSAPGTLRAVIHVTRAATGKTETHELVLTPVEQQDQQPAEQPKEPE
jgi:hypothetical protein